jgi:hypothetical protein
MTRAFLILGLVGLCAVGCGDDEGGSGGAGGAGTTTAANTTTGGTTKATTAANTTATSTTNTVASTTASTTTSGSTGTGMMVDCTPDPNGDPCFECAKENCCDEANTCAMDPECGACLDCIQNTGDIQACAGSGDCDQSDPRTQTAGMCILGSCAADCGLGG